MESKQGSASGAAPGTAAVSSARPVPSVRPRIVLAAVVLTLAGSLVPTRVTLAATITPATGGEAISADTAVLGGTGTYTALVGPAITVAPSELYADRITFTAPSGFEFAKDAPYPSVDVGTTGAAIALVGVNTATVMFDVAASNPAAGTLTFRGLRVRPAPATPLASGSILVRGAGLDGVAGSLVEVPGAAILSFARQPAALGTGGTALSRQPIVYSHDRFGNVRADDPITLSIVPGTGTPGAMLTCNPSTNVAYTQVIGYAFFDGCAIDKAGVGYRIRASSAGSAGVDSDPIQVLTGPPAQLVFRSYPGSPSTTALAPITVAITDAGGNTVPSSATISIRAYEASLTGCAGGLTQATVDGTATFTGCMLPVGNLHAIVASSTGAFSGSKMGERFDVTSGPAASLAFTAQPGGAGAGTPFDAQPVVTIRDAEGRTVTADSSTAVSLSIGTNPSGGTLTCSGGPSVVAVAGVAAFNGCAIDRPGAGYTLQASAAGIAGATSEPFDVTGAGSRLSVAAAPASITLGGSTRLTVHFDGAGAGRAVALEARRAGEADWTPLGSVTTDGSGRATLTVRPAHTTAYRAVFAGASDLAGAASASVTVAVRHSIVLAPRSAGGRRVFASPTKVTYRATERPIAPGQRITFLVYERVRGAWVLRASMRRAADARGVASYTRTWTRGEWYIRARAEATALNAASLSNIEKITVR